MVLVMLLVMREILRSSKRSKCAKITSSFLLAQLSAGVLLSSSCGKNQSSNEPGETSGTENNTVSNNQDNQAPNQTTGGEYFIQLIPSNEVKLGVGGSTELAAQVYQNGELLLNTADRPVILEWASSDPSVFAIDEQGLLKVVGAGEATITATLTRIGDDEANFSSQKVRAYTGNSDNAILRLSPNRIAIDEDNSFKFNVSASDSTGAPTTVDCDGREPTLTAPDVARASYNGATGMENIFAEASSKGFTHITLECGDVTSSPALLEVKSPVVVPPPEGDTMISSSSPNIALADGRLAVSSYNTTAQTLTLSTFDGTWSSKTLDGKGAYGSPNATVFDSANGDRPLVCARETEEDTQNLTCWYENAAGFFVRHVVGQLGPSKFELDISQDGTVYLLYLSPDETLTLATSQGDRSTWATKSLLDPTALDPINPISIRDFTLAITSTGEPRVALELSDDTLYYGQPESTGLIKEPISELANDAGTKVALAIGDNNRPQAVFRNNGNIVWAIRIGGQWFSEVIQPANPSANLVFELNSWNEPRVAYIAEAGGGEFQLRYAWRDRHQNWRVTAPLSRPQASSPIDLEVDAQDRVRIAFSDDKMFGLYIEPRWLDYSLPADTSKDPISNTNPSDNRIAGDVLFDLGPGTRVQKAEFGEDGTLYYTVPSSTGNAMMELVAMKPDLTEAWRKPIVDVLDLVVATDFIYIFGTDTLEAIDRTDGGSAWNKTINNVHASNKAITNKNNLVVISNSKLLVLNETGDELWSEEQYCTKSFFIHKNEYITGISQCISEPMGSCGRPGSDPCPPPPPTFMVSYDIDGNLQFSQEIESLREVAPGTEDDEVWTVQNQNIVKYNISQNEINEVARYQLTSDAYITRSVRVGKDRVYFSSEYPYYIENQSSKTLVEDTNAKIVSLHDDGSLLFHDTDGLNILEADGSKINIVSDLTSAIKVSLDNRFITEYYNEDSGAYHVRLHKGRNFCIDCPWPTSNGVLNNRSSLP